MNKVKLKDICKIEKGKIGISKATPGKYPLVVTAEERASHNEFHFIGPSVIVPLVSSTGHGHASIKRIHYQEDKFAVGNILAVLTPIDQKRLNAKYLYIYLSANKDNLLVSRMRGAANVSLSISALEDVIIELPDYETQLKIIELYTRNKEFENQLLDGISERGKLIENLRQEIIQDAITGKLSEKWRKENSNIETIEIYLEKIKSKVGIINGQKKINKGNRIPFQIPKSWIWCRLGEIISYADNLDIQKKLNKDTIINYVDIDSIDNKKFLIREVKQKRVSDLSTRARRVLKKDYILYSTVRPYLNNIAIIENDLPNFIGTSGFVVFKTFYVNIKYLFYLLLSPYTNKIFKESMNGFNSPSINNQQFEEVMVPLPPIKEIDYIIDKLDSAFNKINNLYDLNNRLEDLTSIISHQKIRQLTSI